MSLRNWPDELLQLTRAAQNGHDEVVEFLLQNGVCPESGDGLRMRPPLHHAAKNGHLGIIKQLLEKSVGHGYRNSPEGKRFSESGALRVAAENGHEAVVRFLLDRFL